MHKFDVAQQKEKSKDAWMNQHHSSLAVHEILLISDWRWGFNELGKQI